MKDEGRAAGGLDPAHERAPQQRSRWGRRSPYGYPRADGAQAPVTYAALDLGTNNCRLLVARPTGDSFRVVDAFSRIIRLGEGVSTSGRISDAAKALRYFGQEHLAGRRQDKLLVQALEQANAETGLQRFHLLPDGGRRHMQLVRRQFETKMPRRGFERAQRIERWKHVSHRPLACHGYAAALQ